MNQLGQCVDPNNPTSVLIFMTSLAHGSNIVGH